MVGNSNKDSEPVKQKTVPDQISLVDLKASLKTKMLAQELNYYSKTTSTNEVARKLAEEGAQDGTVVISESQTKGRGRQGRFWSSPSGGIWLTIILRPDILPKHAPFLTLLTGVVIAHTIRESIKLNATLKWPNDVRINGKKVCGILTELSAEQDEVNYVLIGIGINVNIPKLKFPKELRNQATSLQEILGHSLDRTELIKQILNKFEEQYLLFSKDPLEVIKKILVTWRKLSDTLGRNVEVETTNGVVLGLASDIADDGALLVLSETGEEHRIIAGDCIYLDQ